MPCDLHPVGTCDDVICGKCLRYKFKNGPCICDTAPPETYPELHERARRSGKAQSLELGVSVSIPIYDLPCPVCGTEPVKALTNLDPRMTAEEQLKSDIADTMLAGHNLPIASRSDISACVNALLRMYDVKRKALVPFDRPEKP